MRILVVLLTFFMVGTTSVHADSTANGLLRKIQERGYISDAGLGGRDACPCHIVGVSKQDQIKLIFLATKKNRWYKVTCFALEGGNWLCASPGSVHGFATIIR